MDINISLIDALILSVFCILIVFIVLMIISLGVNLIKIFFYRKSNVAVNRESIKEVKKHLEDKCAIKFEDIDDEDMLIAAFVASIDAVEENDGKTVKIKSIKKM